MKSTNWKETLRKWETEGTSDDWLSFFEETIGEYETILEKGSFPIFMTFLNNLNMENYKKSDAWMEELHWLGTELQRVRKQNRHDDLNLSFLQNKTILLEKMIRALEPLGDVFPQGLKVGMIYEIKKAVLLKKYHNCQRVVDLAIPNYIDNDQSPMAVQEMISPLQASQLYVELAETARKEGILALDDILCDLPIAMSMYMRLVVNGTDPDIIDHTLDFHYDSWNQKIHSLQNVFTVGIKGIIYGDNPDELNNILLVPNYFYTTEKIAEAFEDDPDDIVFYGNDNSVEETYDHRDYIKIIVDMANHARQRGLLSLNDFNVDSYSFPALMLKELILTVFDLGLERVDIDELVSIFFDRIREELVLAKQIITKGTRMLQAGENSSTIKDELSRLVSQNLPLSQEISEYIENLADPESQYALIHFTRLYDQYSLLVNADIDSKKINIKYLEELKKKYHSSQTNMKKFLIEEAKAALLFDKMIIDKKNKIEISYCRRFPELMKLNDFIPKGARDDIAEKMAVLMAETRKKETEALTKIAGEEKQKLSVILNDLDWPSDNETWIDVKKERQGLLDIPIIDHLLGLYRTSSHEIKPLLEKLEKSEPEMAKRLKNNLFLFEDILFLDDHAIQKVLREIDGQELAKSLKGSDDEIKNKIFRNMTDRAVGMIKEDMEYMGAIRKIDIDESRQKILSIISYLEDAGEIVICRSEDDELIV